MFLINFLKFSTIYTKNEEFLKKDIIKKEGPGAGIVQFRREV